MKRVLSLVVVIGIINLILLLGYFLRAPAIQAGAEGAGAAATTNGDCNGDGSLNITDAIYLLQHLFQGGPVPAPIVAKAVGLPATGQTKCYDNAGFEIDCGSADYPGQDGFYKTGCPSEGRFVEHEDGTVTDTCTGLMWKKDAEDSNGNGSIGDGDQLTWQAALHYCEDLNFAGHDDWRLPNVRELQSIVHCGRLRPPIDSVFGAVEVPDWNTYYYWSSSTYLWGPSYAWVACFNSGLLWDGPTGFDKGIRNFVRAVRTIQPGE